MSRDKRALIVFAVIAAVFYVVSFGNFGDNKQKDTKTEPPKIEQKTPEEIARDLKIKRQAEEKYVAERERSRKLLDESKKQRLAEERAAREAEHAANRISVAEFESQFFDRLNRLAQLAGYAGTYLNEPSISINGQIEVLTYKLDNAGEMNMLVRAVNNGVTSVILRADKFNGENIVNAIFMYNFIVQIIAPDTNIETIFNSLSLYEPTADNIKKNQSIAINGYHFEKKLVGKTFELIAAEE